MTGKYDRLGSSHCPGCGGGPCRVAWVLTAGSGYANDPFGATAAITRAHNPVTTPDERKQAARDARARPKLAAQLVPTRRGYGVTIANEEEWIAAQPMTPIGDMGLRRSSAKNSSSSTTKRTRDGAR